MSHRQTHIIIFVLSSAMCAVQEKDLLERFTKGALLPFYGPM